MSIAVPTPEILALQALRRAAARVLDLLITFLARSSAQARHRATSPWEVRLRQWKSLLVDDPARLPEPRPTPDPVPPPPATFDTPHAESWVPFHPPPRLAEPNPEPAVEHLIPSTAAPIEWPPADYIPPPPYPEIATDRPDTDFADHFPRFHFPEPYLPEPYFPESAFVDTVVLDPLPPEPAYPESAHPEPAHPERTVPERTVLEPADVDPSVLEAAVQEAAVLQPDVPRPVDLDTSTWEFTPGDLTRWWEEAYARLDAAVEEHRRHLYADEWESEASCAGSEIGAAR